MHKPVAKEKYEPGVSIVLSVWNEEDVIGGKIENLLSLEYPYEKLEILIGSDGSTDKTNEIVRQLDDARIKLVENPTRRGKMITINELVNKAGNEIIVFTDARQMFAENALRELTANFSDPKVGCVSGELIFSDEGGGTARGINLYWNYEKFIRGQESRIHSMLGATGAIYAIRKDLFTEIPGQLVLDDVFVPLNIIKKGYRAVFDESAKAFDRAADSPREEHRRKVRTLYGNYQIFSVLPEMFNPFNSAVAIQLFSHKFLRLMVPFFMIILFFVNLALASDVLLFKIIFLLQCIFYSVAVTGALARHQKHGMLKFVSRICYVPYVFCLLNFSALAGFARFVSDGQKVTWQKARA